jgi:hypothetical protein
MRGQPWQTLRAAAAKAVVGTEECSRRASNQRMGPKKSRKEGSALPEQRTRQTAKIAEGCNYSFPHSILFRKRPSAVKESCEAHAGYSEVMRFMHKKIFLSNWPVRLLYLFVACRLIARPDDADLPWLAGLHMRQILARCDDMRQGARVHRPELWKRTLMPYVTDMFFKYWIWIDDTLRRMQSVISRGDRRQGKSAAPAASDCSSRQELRVRRFERRARAPASECQILDSDGLETWGSLHPSP